MRLQKRFPLFSFTTQKSRDSLSGASVMSVSLGLHAQNAAFMAATAMDAQNSHAPPEVSMQSNHARPFCAREPQTLQSAASDCGDFSPQPKSRSRSARSDEPQISAPRTRSWKTAVSWWTDSVSQRKQEIAEVEDCNTSVLQAKSEAQAEQSHHATGEEKGAVAK